MILASATARRCVCPERFAADGARSTERQHYNDDNYYYDNTFLPVGVSVVVVVGLALAALLAFAVRRCQRGAVLEPPCSAKVDAEGAPVLGGGRRALEAARLLPRSAHHRPPADRRVPPPALPYHRSAAVRQPRRLGVQPSHRHPTRAVPSPPPPPPPSAAAVDDAFSEYASTFAVSRSSDDNVHGVSHI